MFLGEDGLYWCWRCLKRRVDAALVECSVCEFNEFRRFRYRYFESQRSSREIDPARLTGLWEVDRVVTGEKPRRRGCP